MLNTGLESILAKLKTTSNIRHNPLTRPGVNLKACHSCSYLSIIFPNMPKTMTHPITIPAIAPGDRPLLLLLLVGLDIGEVEIEQVALRPQVYALPQQ